MNMPKNMTWENISKKAFSKAVDKINKISVAKWETSDILPNNDNYDSVCCYFQVDEDDIPMSFAMLFRRSDLPAISKSFIGYGFFVSQKMTRSEELLMEELSNIILNCLISEISNFLGKKIIPSGPKTAQSPKDTAIEIISSALPANAGKITARADMAFVCGGNKIVCEIYSFLPKKFAEKISMS